MQSSVTETNDERERERERERETSEAGTRYRFADTPRPFRISMWRVHSSLYGGTEKEREREREREREGGRERAEIHLARRLDAKTSVLSLH